MFLRYVSKIRDLATKPSIPRSLRVNIELTPGQPNVRKTAKFAAIEEEARKDVEKFQKKFKNHFRAIKEADRDDASALHVVNFVRHLSKLLDMKACYTFARIPNNLKMKFFKNNDRLLSAAALIELLNKKGKDGNVNEVEFTTTANEVALAINAEATETVEDTSESTTSSTTSTTANNNDTNEIEISQVITPTAHKGTTGNVD